MKFRKLSLIYLMAISAFSCQPIENNIIKNPLDNQTYINRAKFPAQVRVSERMNVNITYPSNADGNFIPAKVPYPVILLVQGGAVAKERYQWLADHFAAKGYVVLSPDHLFNLPIFETDNAFLSLTSLINIDKPQLKGIVTAKSKVVIMGHSLGGVVGVYQWLKYDDITGVVLLASYPDEKSNVSISPGYPVLVMSGTNDKKALPETVKKGYSSFSKPKTYAEVKGLNHYGWTDNSTPTELAQDGQVDGNLNDIRNNALNVIDTWLNANILNDQNALNMLKTNTFSGVTLTNE